MNNFMVTHALKIAPVPKIICELYVCVVVFDVDLKV